MGESTLTQDDCIIRIRHPRNANAFETGPNFLQVGHGDVDNITLIKNGDIQNFPQPQNFSSSQVCAPLEPTDTGFETTGTLNYGSESLNFSMTIDQVPYSTNTFKLTYKVAKTKDSNFVQVTFASNPKEEIYGMGLQYTVWNFKGLKVPVISSEGGVGRGLEPLTEVLNTFENNQGGNNMTTYAPAYSFVTNKNRGMVFNVSNIGIADFTEANQTSFLFWHCNEFTQYVIVGEAPKGIVSEMTMVTGRMRPLPDWVSQGVIVGL